MKIRILIPLFILLVAGACRKDIELDPNGYAGVKALLCSKNLDVACGKTAEFEGQSIGLRGKAPEDYREPDGYRFFLYDTADAEYRMEIRVDSLENSDVFAFLSTHADQTILLRGILEGYDQPGNLKCRRGYRMRVVSAADVTAE